jgi:response regulator RpfG family c-di-GMP phosphodiesterase
MRDHTIVGIAMRPSILIAEDDYSLRQLYAEVFDRCGFSPLLTEDGKEAIDLVRSRQPDVLLLDYHLPRANGHGVMKTLVEAFNKEDGQLLSLPAIIVNTCDDVIVERFTPKPYGSSGQDANRIERIVQSEVSLEHDAVISKAMAKGYIADLERAVNETLQQPAWRIILDVKAMMHDLDDTEHGESYRRQLRSFIHEFQRLNILFDSLAREGLTKTEVNARWAYRRLAMQHDPELRYHSRDTAYYAQEIARRYYSPEIAKRLGLGERDIEALKDEVKIACWWHDIGRLPARRFYSESGLLEDEDPRRAFLPLHVDIGEILLDKLGHADRRLKDAVASHHERPDGTGYHGWREGMPFDGILPIADMIDSVKRRLQKVEDREDAPAPIGPDAIKHAAAELLKYRGTRFHPDTTEAGLDYLHTELKKQEGHLLP